MIDRKDRLGRDDSDLHDGPATPAQSGSSGGGLARDVGTRDEERAARGGEPEPTRATKADKLQPRMPTRADHEGAQR